MSLDLSSVKLGPTPSSPSGTGLDLSKLDITDASSTRQNWEELIRNFAKKNGVDPNQAVQLSRFESGLNPNAYRQDTDVRGLFQVRSDKAIGAKNGSPYIRTINGQKYDLRNPQQNIQAGLALWKTALQQNKNDPRLAYSRGYNPGYTGPGPFPSLDKPSGPAHMPQAQAGPLSLQPGLLTGGKIPTGTTYIRAPKPGDHPEPNLLERIAGVPYSLLGGALQGLTGLQFETRNPQSYGDLEAGWAGQKPTGQVPTFNPVGYKPIQKVAEWGTYAVGVNKITNLIRSGAIKLTPTLAGRVLTSGLNKLPIKNQVRLLTPLALGMGTFTGIQSSVQQIYEHGHLDPKIVGEEAAVNAGLTFILPEASVLFSNLASKGVSLAPQLLRFLPASVGANPAAVEQTIRGIQSFKPFRAPITLWETAAKGLSSTYRAAGKINPGVQERLVGLQRLSRWMDGFLKEQANAWQFPSHRGWNMPADSPIDPTQIFMSLNRERNWLQYSLGSRKFTGPNIGGGIGGQITNNIFASQLEKLYLALRGSDDPVNKNGAWYALSAAKRLRRLGGKWAPAQLDNIIGSLNNTIRLPRFRTYVTDAYGNRLPTQSKDEGDFLQFMRDLYLLHRRSTAPGQIASRTIRSWINHALLGMGNVASALTVLNRVSFPLSTEGAENVAAAFREIQSNSKIYNDYIRVLGLEEPYTALGELKKTKLANLSFGFYDWAEKRALPAAAMSRFFKLAKQGIPYKEAFLQGERYATQLRTSMDWDLNPFLRDSRAITGPAVRLMFQFFPFAGKSASLAGGMGLDEFTKYAAYMFSFGGMKGIPGAVVIDRALTSYMGHSVLNSLLARPEFHNILYGLPGMTLGLDIGSRHNWTNSLMDKVLGLSKPAFVSYAQNVGNSYYNLVTNPNGRNAIRAFTSVVTGLGQFVNALDDEKHGAILDRAGYPYISRPTGTELGQRALGFTPVDMSREEALRAEKSAETNKRTRELQNAYQSFRVAWLDHDQNAMRQAIKRIHKIDPSISPETLIGQLKREAMPPAQRDLRSAPRTIRRDLLQILRP